MDKTATAIAIAAVMVAAGFSVAPSVTASDTDCHKDFDIPDSEPLVARTLQADDREIGREDVNASDGNETLRVEMVDPGTAGELTWTVHEQDGSCVEYTDGGCDENNVLDSKEEVRCTLVAPDSGDKSYWVEFVESSGNNSIDYKTWAN